MPLTRPYCCDNCRHFRPTIASSHLPWLLQYASPPQPMATSSSGLCLQCASSHPTSARLASHQSGLTSSVLGCFRKGKMGKACCRLGQRYLEVQQEVQRAPRCLFAALAVQQLIHNADKVVVGNGDLTVLPSPAPGGWWMVNWLEEVAVEQRQQGPCTLLSARPLPITYGLWLFCKSKRNGCSLAHESQNMPSRVILSAIDHESQPGAPSIELCASPQAVPAPGRPRLWSILNTVSKPWCP